MKVVFILGSGHCGSTLLDLILDSHSEIFGTGELESFSSDGICACGKILKNCNFWSSINKQVSLNNLPVYRKKIAFLFGWNNFYIRINKKWVPMDDCQKFIKRNENIFSQVMEKGGAKVVVDSSKNPDRAELLSRSQKIQPIIIHLFRDGRAVSWSYIKKYQKFLPYMRKWFMSNIKIEILRRRIDAKYIFIKYEDLAKKPDQVIKKILNILDLKYEEGILQFRRKAHHQIGGNRMKLNQTEEIKEDNEWRKKMPFRYRILFNFFVGWLNYYYLKRRR